MRKTAAVVAILVIALLVLWLAWPSKPPAAPDLTGCTRVEIRYQAGALYYLLGLTSHSGELSQQEKDYVRSFDEWTLTDRERIDAFAKRIKEGVYARVVRAPITGEGAYVTGYRGSTAVTSFLMFPRTIRDPGYRIFKYSVDLSIEPAGIEALRTRRDCFFNMGVLHLERMLRSRPSPPLPPLDPNHWCDDYVEVFRRHGRGDDVIAKVFACPSVHPILDANGTRAKPVDARLATPPAQVWTSDYAMNPYCDVNSPGDVVFLFEAKPGWNQHGGPELFNFDNHDPKGGCVRLNDGTVKFIRTQEELAQLRWKP